jgi:hypothetical protein
MPKLSDDQLAKIANLLHDLSAAVGQIRLNAIHVGTPLSDPKIVQLFGLQLGLLNTSSSFFMQAAQVTLQDADKVANQVVSATEAAKDALKTLEKIDRVITIVSAVGVLAASVMTGKLDQIGNAAKGVFDAIQSGPGEN